ncbi:F-box/kelch-repeat protein At3g23880-like [Andrographis paniculata]|uniref:F-box/kelch-repeat protein At3g23880-like n=1 Tax=Andrographis paniculata TaxID=175694 RepID=UPI0021E6F6E5|nr:F-box/kelch-repeat protein At3g23880-like [Andrographis paniculata]
MDGNLPPELIEEILFRLPAKALLRFKAVSQSWHSVITSVYFAAAHLNHEKTGNGSYSKKNRYLIPQGSHAFPWRHHLEIELDTDGNICAWPLVNNGLRGVPKLLNPRRRPPYDVLCCCDGLFVTGLTRDKRKMMQNRCAMIWNPSTQCCVKFQCPNFVSNIHGLVPDPTVSGEYKFVKCDMKKYAVYKCRSKSWSEIKSLDESIFMLRRQVNACKYRSRGIFSNGNLFWLVININIRPSFEVVCFDAKEEKFQRLPNLPLETPVSCDGYHCAYLVPCADGNFCLFYKTRALNGNAMRTEGRILMLKSSGNGQYSWADKQIRVPLDAEANNDHLVFLQGEIMIFRGIRSGAWSLFHYNTRDRTFKEIRRGDPVLLSMVDYSAPHYDNLFFLADKKKKKTPDGALGSQ